MSHCDDHRSIHPAYTGEVTPGHTQVVAAAPFSSCQPSTWMLQAAAAAAVSRASPRERPPAPAPAGTVNVHVSVVHAAVADPVNVAGVPDVWAIVLRFV